MPAGHGCRAGIHQHEAAGAVGVLGHAGREAGLAEGGGLLVAGHAGHGHGSPEHGCRRLAEHATGRPHMRQHRWRDVEEPKQFIVPLQGMDVEQQGARRVAGIGRMHAATGQLPQQPAVDGAECQLAGLGARTGTGHVVQQPLQLGGGEIGIQHQAGLVLDACGQSPLAQCVTLPRRTPVLPDDGRRHGLAGLAVPQHRGLALVGDTQGTQLRCTQPRAGQRLAGHRQLRAPDLHGIVLDPARLRKMLSELLLRHGDDGTMAVEHERARTGGALVEGEDVLGMRVHGRFRSRVSV